MCDYLVHDYLVYDYLVYDYLVYDYLVYDYLVYDYLVYDYLVWCGVVWCGVVCGVVGFSGVWSLAVSSKNKNPTLRMWGINNKFLVHSLKGNE